MAMIWKDGQLVEGEMYTHECKVCKAQYEDTSDEPFICVDCEDEYAEWLEEMGYVVGEFDCYDHPNFKPDAHKGTKWEHMND